MERNSGTKLRGNRGILIDRVARNKGLYFEMRLRDGSNKLSRMKRDSKQGKFYRIQGIGESLIAVPFICWHRSGGTGTLTTTSPFPPIDGEGSLCSISPFYSAIHIPPPIPRLAALGTGRSWRQFQWIHRGCGGKRLSHETEPMPRVSPGFMHFMRWWPLGCLANQVYLRATM